VALIRRLWRWLRSPWSADRVFAVFAMVMGGTGAIAIIVAVFFVVKESRDVRRREAQMTEAEHRIHRWAMPDGTVCYESRYGYGISCLRP
jgi:hypothetical protein